MRFKQMIPIASSPSSAGLPPLSTHNPAVAQCCKAFNAGFQAARATGMQAYEASLEGSLAYRVTMPPLEGAENIRNFIACVAHGMILEVFSPTDGARLLYAAQVAHGAAARPVNPPRNPA